MSITSSDIGKSLTFTTRAPAILGSKYTALVLVGILDHESAMSMINVPVLAATVYPSLPEGTSKDYTRYQYLKFKKEDGGNLCVALEWIDLSTVVIHEGVSLSFKIENASRGDAEKIRKILAFNGYTAINFQSL